MGSCFSTPKRSIDTENPRSAISKESSPIVRLPDQVLLIVHSFLCLQPRTIHNDGCFKYFRDCTSGGIGDSLEWNKFLQTTKSFQELKLESTYLSLSAKIFKTIS
jgi:hypothetical protein